MSDLEQILMVVNAQADRSESARIAFNASCSDQSLHYQKTFVDVETRAFAVRCIEEWQRQRAMML